MKSISRRKCRNCRELFRPDPRNLRHQRYCSKPACRKASKADSQRRWLGKAENQDYFRGAANVQRVQAWRAAHPGYSRRAGSQTGVTLQEDSLSQPVEIKGKIPTLTELALQDVLDAQPLVLIGLIANITGMTLQEDIAETGRRLRQLGQDIVCGAQEAHDAKTSADPFPSTPDPPPVQLGGSTPGA